MATIRTERPDDLPAVHALIASCFPTPAEARLVDRLRDAGNLSVSLVAEEGGAIVGHVALSPVATEDGDTGFGLAPVCVAEARRERGVAADLIRAAIAEARAQGFAWGVVLGEPSYYSRFGFHAASAFGLRDAYAGGDAFQALEVFPGAMPVGAGLVRYAPEFDALG